MVGLWVEYFALTVNSSWQLTSLNVNINLLKRFVTCITDCFILWRIVLYNRMQKEEVRGE